MVGYSIAAYLNSIITRVLASMRTQNTLARIHTVQISRRTYHQPEGNDTATHRNISTYRQWFKFQLAISEPHVRSRGINRTTMVLLLLPYLMESEESLTDELDMRQEPPTLNVDCTGCKFRSFTLVCSCSKNH